MRLNGGPELLDLLDQLPKKIGRNAVRRGAYAAAGVLRKGARERVRRKSGAVAKTLKISSRIDGNIVSAKVTMKGYHSFIGVFLEYGVKPHEITKKAKRGAEASARRSLVIDGKYVGARVHHPGHGEFPFMRPTLDADGPAAINVMGETIATSLSWQSLQAPLVSVTEEEEA